MVTWYSIDELDLSIFEINNGYCGTMKWANCKQLIHDNITTSVKLDLKLEEGTFT